MLILLVPFTTHASRASAFGNLSTIIKHEPSLDVIIAAALQHESLHVGSNVSWGRRIRMAAWLPTLYVGYDHQIKQSQSLSVGDTISVSSGIVTVGPDDTDIDYDNNTGQVFRVRAVWNLDALVFNRELFNLAREQRDQISLRLSLSEKIGKLLEQRYQALNLYFRHRASSSSKAEDAAIKFILLTEWLDQLTGKQFSKKFFRLAR